MFAIYRFDFAKLVNSIHPQNRTSRRFRDAQCFIDNSLCKLGKEMDLEPKHYYLEQQMTNAVFWGIELQNLQKKMSFAKFGFQG